MAPHDLGDGDGWADPENFAEEQEEVEADDVERHGDADADDAERHGEEAQADDALEDVDLDELCDSLQGYSSTEAEAEIRSALRKMGRDPASVEADTLAAMLKVMKLLRESALKGYDSWENLHVPAFCDHLTSACDKHIVSTDAFHKHTLLGGQDLQYAIVAIVYAECGRTLGLADELSKARDRLEKALNVFAVLHDSADTATLRQEAAAKASLARLQKRLGGAAGAQSHYLQALRAYAELESGPDTAEIVGEFCELLGKIGLEALSPVTLSLLTELAAAKFEQGSEQQVRAFRQIADACLEHGQLVLAAPALSARAKALRLRCAGGRGGMFAEAEAEAAEEEAASALEARVQPKLEEGDIEGAVASWSEALALRERAQGAESEVVASMRETLAVLQQVAEAKAAAESGARVPDSWDD